MGSIKDSLPHVSAYFDGMFSRLFGMLLSDAMLTRGSRLLDYAAHCQLPKTAICLAPRKSQADAFPLRE